MISPIGDEFSHAIDFYRNIIEMREVFFSNKQDLIQLKFRYPSLFAEPLTPLLATITAKVVLQGSPRTFLFFNDSMLFSQCTAYM